MKNKNKYLSKLVFLVISLLSLTCIKNVYSASITSNYVVIDDFEGTSVPDRPWFYTRTGSDLGAMSGGNGVATIGNGLAELSANDSGWAGVWLHTYHIATPNLMMNTHQVLGPYIKAAYQAKIEKVKVFINDGAGEFKVEIIDGTGALKYVQTYPLSGGNQTLELDVSNGGIAFDIKQINLIAGIANSWVKVDELGLELDSPTLTTEEAVFLYSYAHMSHQYDANLGLVGERASWEVGALPFNNGAGRGTAGVPATSLFALATALGKEMGYVKALEADNIIRKIHDKMQVWPTEKGLLPHFLQMNNSGDMVIRPRSEYSSVDTAIALSALILADNIIGLDSTPIEVMAKNIDWAHLTNNYSESVSHGYDEEGNLLSWVNGEGKTIYPRWDVFGSESYIISILHAASTGKSTLLNEVFQIAPTWDGSGFNDEMAALFFPVNDGNTDAWGNDWEVFRHDMRTKQLNHVANNYSQWLTYENLGLFGFSASEVPEKWMVSASDEYKAWGVGGHAHFHDGVNHPGVNYPIVAPHYAAMIAAEEPEAFNAVFNYLMKTQKAFTPLNNVESFGLGTTESEFHWNSLKGSWNLGLQTLGVARALQQKNNQQLTYDALRNNQYLKTGFDHMTFDASDSNGMAIPSGTKLEVSKRYVFPGLENIFLVMQTDGNLVTYQDVPRKALWSTRTHGNHGAIARFQGDGNLVIKNGGNVIWKSATQNQGAKSLQVNEWGMPYMTNNSGGSVWIASNVTLIPLGTKLQVGERYYWVNNRFLTMQTDGNLVIYQDEPRKELWSSGTSGNPGATARFQNDGNFVIKKRKVIWKSGTSNKGAKTLHIDTGVPVIKNVQGKTIWSGQH